MIINPDGSEQIKDGRVVTGNLLDQSTYRSELTDQLGIASFLSNLIIPIGRYPILTVYAGITTLGKVGI